MSPEGGDCDDSDPTVHPGAPERCDDVDHDCDGELYGGSNLVFRYEMAASAPYVGEGGTDYGWSSLSWGRILSDDEADADPGLVDGRPLVLRFDEPLDGLFEERYLYEYGGAEGPDRVLGWPSGEKEPDEEWVYTYQNDRVVHVTYDLEIDGVVEAVWTYTYFPSGGFDRDYDEGGDGLVELRERVEVDSEGRMIRFTEDFGVDGRLEFEETWAYDAFDNVTHYTLDEDGDGRLEREEISTFDLQGNGVWFTVDSDGDGVVDTRWEHDRDADGNLVDYRRDDDGDGTWDYLSTRTWEDGLLMVYERDADADGAVDYRSTNSYDPQGNVVEYTEDVGADGQLDLVSYNTWNELGQRTEYTRDDGADGSIDYRSVYGYDADGWYVSRRTDADMDGVDDVIFDVTCEGSIAELDLFSFAEAPTWQLEL